MMVVTHYLEHVNARKSPCGETPPGRFSFDITEVNCWACREDVIEKDRMRRVRARERLTP
jgi:hypothetical protein